MAKDGMTDEQSELWELIERVRVAQMATHQQDGSLRSRPMWTQGDRIDDGALWFFASKRGAAVAELRANAQLALAYGSPSEDMFISVSGTAALVEDRARAEKLWNTFAEAWFPGGVDDPNLQLIRVDVDSAQYWVDDKPKVLQFAEIALGAITGNPPQSGEERKLDFDAA